MIKLILSFGLLLSLSSAVANTDKLFYVNNSDRVIRIISEINQDLLKKIPILDKLAKPGVKNPEPIILLINSPGGVLVAGELFIQAMKVAQSRGYKLVCISTIYSASMAFNIMAKCDQRVVLRETLLMFHPVRIGYFGHITAPVALELKNKLNKIDKRWINYLQKSMGMDNKILKRYYYKERIWKAYELSLLTKKGWLTIVKDIKGLPNMFESGLTDGKTNNILKRLKTGE